MKVYNIRNTLKYLIEICQYKYHIFLRISPPQERGVTLPWTETGQLTVQCISAPQSGCPVSSTKCYEQEYSPYLDHTRRRDSLQLLPSYTVYTTPIVSAQITDS